MDPRAPIAVVTVMLVIAGTAAQAAGRLDRIRSHGVLRVCIWPENAGMSWRDPRSGTVKGLDADMAAALAGDLGVRLAYIDTAGMAAIPPSLDRDACDVAMSGVVVSREREALVRFSKPYLRHTMVAVTARSTKRIRGWNDLDHPGTTIGLLQGTASDELARRMFTRASLTPIVPPATRERALEAGRIDGFLTSYPIAVHFTGRNNWTQILVPERPIAVFDYAYAIKTGDDAWAAELDRFVAAVRADGRLTNAAREHGLTPMLIGGAQ